MAEFDRRGYFGQTTFKPVIYIYNHIGSSKSRNPEAHIPNPHLSQEFLGCTFPILLPLKIVKKCIFIYNIYFK